MNFDGETNKISEKWFESNMFLGEQLLYITEINNKECDFSIIEYIDYFFSSYDCIYTFRNISLYIVGYQKCFFETIVSKVYKLNEMCFTVATIIFIFYAMPYVPYIGMYLTINNRLLSLLIEFILNYTAYFAEIFRGGFSSVEKGQNKIDKSNISIYGKDFVNNGIYMSRNKGIKILYNIGFIFQYFNLFNNLTVIQNI